MIEVVPAIIPEHFEHLSESVEKVAEYVSRVQVDVMDGKYAPTKSWPYEREGDWAFKQLIEGKEELPHKEKLIYELDMMVEGPETYIDDWVKAGIKTFIIHFGSTRKLAEIIEKIRGLSLEIGIACKPSTELSALFEWIPQVDFVQHMGNDNIGRHGVSLDSFVLPRISELKKRFPDLIISVDIGVNRETAPILVAHGANKLVSGSAIFNSDNIEETIGTFRNLDQQTQT